MRKRLAVATTLGALALTGCSCGSPSVDDAGPEAGASIDGGGLDAAPPDGGAPDGQLPPGTDGGTGVGGLTSGPLCTPAGWCWETPLPSGEPIRSLWAPAPGQLVAATAAQFLHVDGDDIRWALTPTAPVAGPVPVWGPSPDDLWAGGAGGTLRFEGGRWSAWSPSLPGGGRALSGFGPLDVWAVSISGLHHYDGAWSTVEPDGLDGALYADVWAVGPQEAVVVGRAGASGFVARATRSSVVDLAFPEAGLATAVYASAPDDVWVVVGAALWHRVGGSWETVATTSRGLVELSGSGPDDVWAVGYDTAFQWDGSSIVTHSIDVAEPGLAAVASAGPDDVWVADGLGQLLHWDGTSWTPRFQVPLARDTFTSVAARGEDAWAVAGRTATLARRASDGTWTAVSSPSASPARVALPADETFLFGLDGAHRWDGAAWGATPSGDGLRDACATDDGSIHGVGARIASYSAGAWVDGPPISLIAVFERVRCVGDEAWATTGLGTALRYDGSAWRYPWFPRREARSIRGTHASAADDGWAIVAGTAGDGVVMRWDGATWTSVDAPPAVWAVGGAGPDDVWLAGDGGIVRRWDGATWASVDLPIADDVRWIHALGDGTARALTASGAVWDYGPAGAPAWARTGVDLGTSVDVSDAALVDAAFVGGDVFAVGDGGGALRFTAGAWSELSGFGWDEVEGSPDAGTWFLGSSGVHRLEGATLVRDLEAPSADRILVPARGDAVFALGPTSVHRRAGGTWALDGSFEDGCCAGGFAADADHAVVLSLGEDGWVERRDASGWLAVDEPRGVIAVARSADGRTLALSTDLMLWRLTDAGWSRVVDEPVGLSGDGIAGHVFAADDAWVITQRSLVHFDGTQWGPLRDAIGVGFTDLTATPDGVLYAVGEGADVVRRAP